MAASAIRGTNQLWAGIESGNAHQSTKGILDLGAATAVGVAMMGPGAWAKGAAFTAVGLMGGRAVYDVWSPDQTLSARERTTSLAKSAGQFAGGLGASAIAWSQSPIAMPSQIARPLAVAGGTLGLLQGAAELYNGPQDRIASLGRIASGSLSVAAGLTGSPTLGAATVLAGAATTAWTTVTEAKELGARAKRILT